MTIKKYRENQNLVLDAGAEEDLRIKVYAANATPSTNEDDDKQRASLQDIEEADDIVFTIWRAPSHVEVRKTLDDPGLTLGEDEDGAIINISLEGEETDLEGGIYKWDLLLSEPIDKYIVTSSKIEIQETSKDF